MRICISNLQMSLPLGEAALSNAIEASFPSEYKSHKCRNKHLNMYLREYHMIF